MVSMPQSPTFTLEERSFATPDDAKDFALRCYRARFILDVVSREPPDPAEMTI